jgi:hypothetical protein
MVNKIKHLYLVNSTMQDKLTLIANALKPDSGIKFKTPIAHLIPRIPMTSIVGDSLLLACGGYSIILKFWWHLLFQDLSRPNISTGKINCFYRYIIL